MIAARTSMAELSKAITKVLSTNFFYTTWVSTAWATDVESRVTTGKKTLADEVSTVTTMGRVSAVFATIVGIWSARFIPTAAAVVGRIPPCAGIIDGSTPVIAESKAEESEE